MAELSGVSPLSIGLRKEALDIETRPSQTNFQETLRAGVGTAETFNAVMDDSDAREKAKEFEKVLQQGKQGLIQFIEQAENEGLDVTGLRERAAVSDTPETIQSSWKITVDKFDRQLFGEKLETEGAAGASRFAAKKSLIKPETAIKQQQEAETLTAVEKLLESVGGKPGRDDRTEVEPGDVEEVVKDPEPILTTDDDLKQRKAELQKQRNKLSSSALASEPAIVQRLKQIDKEIGEIETVQRERRLTNQFFTREKNKKIDQTVRDLENETRVGLGVQFVDAAIPGGIFSSVENIEGVGAGSKLWREWLKTDEAIKVNSAIKNYLGAVRKRDAGVAVTEREAKFLEQQFGLNLRGTVRDFLEAFRIKADEAKANLDKAWGRFTPAEQEEIKRTRPGLIFPDDIPQPGRRGGKIRKEDVAEPRNKTETVEPSPDLQQVNERLEEIRKRKAELQKKASNK